MRKFPPRKMRLKETNKSEGGKESKSLVFHLKEGRVGWKRGKGTAGGANMTKASTQWEGKDRVRKRTDQADRTVY